MNVDGSEPWFDAFERARPRLLALAYRMLGQHAEAQDVVQDAALRWAGRETGPVHDAEGYLVRTTTRLCIDRLRRAQRDRERYVGPWLPEPIVAPLHEGPEHLAEVADALQLALLVVLETLRPRERAAFLLREAFGLTFREVAEAVGTSESNARQIVHRARTAVGVRRMAAPDRAAGERLAQAFLGAAREGNIDALMALLAEDASVTSDGGGVVPAARRRVEGADRVARFTAGVCRKLRQRGAQAEVLDVGGAPGLLFHDAGTPVAAWALETDGERIQALYVVVNPDKLKHVRAGGRR